MFVCRKKKRFVDLSADDVLNSLSNFKYFEIEFIRLDDPNNIQPNSNFHDPLQAFWMKIRKIHYRNKIHTG